MRTRKIPLIIAMVGASALGSCGGDEQQSNGSAPPIVVLPPPPSPPPPPPSPPIPSGTLLFADEFNAGSLDRTKWNVEGPAFWVNEELQAYVDESTTIGFGTPSGADGGALVLKPVYRPNYVTPTGRTTNFVSGRINTANKYDVTYGRISARIRMPDAAGVWPAFWMLGYGNWPDSGEIDIMEYVGVASWTSSALHGPGYSGNTPLNKRQDFPAGTNVADWHEYTVERSADSVTFFVDDRQIYRVMKSDVERFGAWRFDRPQYLILNFALGGVYPQGINAITTPYFGMPQSTADAVARGEIAMEVDWVRVWSH